MGLTSGTGPFGRRPSGQLSFAPPEHVVYVEPWPRRVRAFANGEPIVDSERTVLVHESGRLPHYAFPAADVFVAAKAEPEVEGYVTVPWPSAERWLEEDEEVIVHPRDPYHRIDVVRSSRLVQVRLAGEQIAESARSQILFETGLAPRYYLPVDDVRMDALEPAELRTGCPYKGWARYWDAATGSGRAPAVAWSYPDPLPEATAIEELLCFFQERPELEVLVDAVAVESTPTPWSGTAWLDEPWVIRTAPA